MKVDRRGRRDGSSQNGRLERKGHSWVVENELAHYKAKGGVAVGKSFGLREVDTPGNKTQA